MGVREAGRGFSFLPRTGNGWMFKVCQVLGSKRVSLPASSSSFKGRSQKSRISLKSCPCNTVGLTSIGIFVSFF